MKEGYLSVIIVTAIVSVFIARQVSENRHEEREINFPCSGAEYYSTLDFIRAVGIEENQDNEIAKKMSKSKALENLNSKILITIISIISNNDEIMKENLETEFKKIFIEEKKIITKTIIINHLTICEKFTKTHGLYKCYITVEIDCDKVLKPIYKKLLDLNVFGINYNYADFKKTCTGTIQRNESNI